MDDSDLDRTANRSGLVFGPPAKDENGNDWLAGTAQEGLGEDSSALQYPLMVWPQRRSVVSRRPGKPVNPGRRGGGGDNPKSLTASVRPMPRRQPTKTWSSSSRIELRVLLEDPQAGTLRVAPKRPTVYLIAGVNGSGKTTSIAKLSQYLKDQGNTILLAACDTFRAAAADQLSIWADRAGCEIVRGARRGRSGQRGARCLPAGPGPPYRHRDRRHRRAGCIPRRI